MSDIPPATGTTSAPTRDPDAELRHGPVGVLRHGAHPDLEPAQSFAKRANAIALSPPRPGGRQLSCIHSNAHTTCEAKRYQWLGRVYLMVMDRFSQSPRTNCPGQFWENRSQGCSRAHRGSANLCSLSPATRSGPVPATLLWRDVVMQRSRGTSLPGAVTFPTALSVFPASAISQTIFAMSNPMIDGTLEMSAKDFMPGHPQWLIIQGRAVGKPFAPLFVLVIKRDGLPEQQPQPGPCDALY